MKVIKKEDAVFYSSCGFGCNCDEKFFCFSKSNDPVYGFNYGDRHYDKIDDDIEILSDIIVDEDDLINCSDDNPVICRVDGLIYKRWFLNGVIGREDIERPDFIKKGSYYSSGVFGKNFSLDFYELRENLNEDN